jgi:hypothetical protein
MNTIKQAKIALKDAIKTEVTRLIKKDKNIKELQKLINQFSSDCYMNGSIRDFNENSDYVSMLRTDFSLNDYDEDLKIELIATLNEDTGVHLLEYDKQLVLESFLGEPTTINFSDRRNCFAIHSNELKIKVMYQDLIGSDESEKLLHALYIIECNMRKYGVFGDIVEVDYNGGVVKEHSTGLGNLSDDELTEYSKQFKQEDEE